MSPAANVDNHVFSPESAMTYAYTDSEMKSLSTIFAIRTNIIATDEFNAGNQMWTQNNVESFDNMVVFRDVDKLHGTTVLIRKKILGSPFKIYSTIYKLDYNLISALDNANFSRIYDSDSVYGYV
jgi:hypothetical protein